MRLKPAHVMDITTFLSGWLLGLVCGGREVSNQAIIRHTTCLTYRGRRSIERGVGRRWGKSFHDTRRLATESASRFLYDGVGTAVRRAIRSRYGAAALPSAKAAVHPTADAGSVVHALNAVGARRIRCGRPRMHAGENRTKRKLIY